LAIFASLRETQSSRPQVVLQYHAKFAAGIDKEFLKNPGILPLPGDAEV
jgi:hypothetical protein